MYKPTNKDLSIYIQVAYKVHAEKGELNWNKVIEDARGLYQATDKLCQWYEKQNKPF